MWSLWVQPAPCQPPPQPVLLPEGKRVACPRWSRGQPARDRVPGIRWELQLWQYPARKLGDVLPGGRKCIYCRQLASLAGLIGLKAILLAGIRQAQGAAGCLERNTLEPGVRVKQGTTQVGALWPAGVLWRCTWTLGNSAWSSCLSVHTGL